MVLKLQDYEDIWSSFLRNMIVCWACKWYGNVRVFFVGGIHFVKMNTEKIQLAGNLTHSLTITKCQTRNTCRAARHLGIHFQTTMRRSMSFLCNGSKTFINSLMANLSFQIMNGSWKQWQAWHVIETTVLTMPSLRSGKIVVGLVKSERLLDRMSCEGSWTFANSDYFTHFETSQ